MNLRLLVPGDLADLLSLSEAAGWNQTPEDWLRVMRLAPGGCFGVELDGRVAATTTQVEYGELGWIGMVLTHPDYRRRGLALALMRHALDGARARVLRLDATAMGAPLYRQLGFADEHPIERWARAPAAFGPAPAALAPFRLAEWREADAEAFGADRGALLASLDDGETCGEGFAFSRPGRLAAYFGPCLALTPAAAESLLASFLARYGTGPTAWDLDPGHPHAPALAAQYGFQPVRALIRMRRGPGSPHRPEVIYAPAGFEFG
jgi:GNAT superfamily N-acetyltransferase